jgi:hypothetical protein
MDIRTRSTPAARAATRSPKPTRSTAVVPAPPPDVENSRERSTIAAKSATDAAAMVVCPTGSPTRPATFSTGTTSPSDVAVRATARNSGADVQPAA